MISPAQTAYLQQFPTPFYFYDLDLLGLNLYHLKAAADKRDFIVHYAIKANTDPLVLQSICKAGLGADCVSGNEVKLAIATGFEPGKIVFAGVGKTDQEIEYALTQNIFCFNCESYEELEILESLAAKQHKIANIALRINPDVNANTHHYITTGMEENKFGVQTSQIPALLALIKASKHLKLLGLHFHIGSQITDLSVFANLCTRINQISSGFYEAGIDLQHLNVGGGLGINYKLPDQESIPDYEKYFDTFKRFLKIRNKQEVHFELGRSIVAACGSLISRVILVKKGQQKQFAILDAGMTELIRPALYQAFHSIENLSAAKQSETATYDVVGPVCESSDCFAKALELPLTHRGDLIAIRSAGAYGQVMASNYNQRLLEATQYWMP